MEAKLQQRVVGVLVLAAFVLLIAPVLLDAEGRIPEKITNIPPQPKRADMSQLDQIQLPGTPLPELPVSDADVEPTSTDIIPTTVVSTASDDEKVSTRLWSVQVASFRDSVKAAVLRDTLRDLDMKAYTREKLLSDESIFTQVFVGPVDSKAAAEQLKRKVKEKVNEQGLVVRYRE